jgi:integrase
MSERKYIHSKKAKRLLKKERQFRKLALKNRDYPYAFLRFIRFCKTLGFRIRDFPPSNELVRMWLTELVDTDKSYATLRQAKAAIVDSFLNLGEVNPFDTDAQTRLTYKRYSALLSVKLKITAPAIPIEIFRALVDLAWAHPNDLLLWSHMALFVTGLATSERPTNLAGLRRLDIRKSEVCDEDLCIFFPPIKYNAARTRTIGGKKRKGGRPLTEEDLRYDVPHIITTFLDKLGWVEESNGFVFGRVTNNMFVLGLQPPTIGYVTDVVFRRCAELGMDVEATDTHTRVTGRSLRKSAIHQATKNVSLAAGARIAGHKSTKTTKQYTHDLANKREGRENAKVTRLV